MTRAVLFASATAASFSGLRATSLPIQETSNSGFFRPHRMTESAPITSSRRIVRSPILVMLPSLVLPPVEFCRGTRPSQVSARSEPLHIRNARQDRTRGNGSHAWHGQKPGRIGLGTTTAYHRCFHLIDLLVQLDQLINEHWDRSKMGEWIV